MSTHNLVTNIKVSDVNFRLGLTGTKSKTATGETTNGVAASFTAEVPIVRIFKALPELQNQLAKNNVRLTASYSKSFQVFSQESSLSIGLRGTNQSFNNCTIDYALQIKNGETEIHLTVNPRRQKTQGMATSQYQKISSEKVNLKKQQFLKKQQVLKKQQLMSNQQAEVAVKNKKIQDFSSFSSADGSNVSSNSLEYEIGEHVTDVKAIFSTNNNQQHYKQAYQQQLNPIEIGTQTPHFFSDFLTLILLVLGASIGLIGSKKVSKKNCNTKISQIFYLPEIQGEIPDWINSPELWFFYD